MATPDPPPLYGLVLAGGQSRRMGQDKGSLAYHGSSQRRHCHDLLQPFCREVHVSCRPDQAAGMEPDLPLLLDGLSDVGLLAGLSAAFDRHPAAAWLVVACDLPWLDGATLAHLIAARQPEAVATAFRSPEDGGPEPLVAIWEPRAAALVAHALGQGHRSPRRLLAAVSCHLVDAPDPRTLRNVNTPDELEQARSERP